MTQRELTTADYIAMLRRRWVLILILALVGPPLAYGISRFLPNRYKSQTLVLIEPPSVPTTVVPQIDTTSIGEQLASMQQQVLSRSHLEPLIHQFGLFPGDIDRVPMEELVGRLQKAIEVTPPVLPMMVTGPSDLPGFYIGVTWDDPRTAQEICTTVTSMFIEQNLSLQTQHSDQTTQFLTQQLADAKTNLDAQDAKLAEFQGRHIGSLPDDAQTNLNILTGLTSQLDSANQALGRAQQDKSYTESLLAQQLASWQASQSGNNPETLEAQIDAQQTQLTSLQARYTDDYPDVIKAKADLAALQKKLAENTNSKGTADSKPNPKSSAEPGQITQLRGQIFGLDQLIAEKTKEQERIQQQIQIYQNRVQASPEVEEQFKQLTRGYQTALDSYNELLKKRDEAVMSAALNRDQQGEQFRVLDPAGLPDKPSFPNRPLFALEGLGGGLALGLGLAFFLEMRDTSFRTERDVEVTLQLPVLAMVPAIEPAISKRLKSAGVNPPTSSSLGLNAGV